MIHVTEIGTSRGDGQAVLRARIRCQGSTLDGAEWWLRYPFGYEDYLSLSADPWIALLLWPAMRLGRSLQVEGVASPMLMEAIPTLMDIMHCWDSRFRPVEIRAPTASPARNAGTAVASFFSGGVDSFYTALKHAAPEKPVQARITHLISVQGLDVKLHDEALWGRVRNSLRPAAESLGCTWVECATNVREFVPEELVTWFMYHGGVLAGISLGIQGLWNRVLIPADQTYAETTPSGTHPLLNPLWSTESVRIGTDGAEATRIEKITSRLAQSEAAQRYLRVCWENREGRYNCGECEKCVRTMVALKIAGVLDKFTSFDRLLSYKAISSLKPKTPVQRLYLVQNYQAAQAAGSDPLVVRALKRCVHPSVAWRLRCLLFQSVKHLVRRIDGLVLGGSVRRWYRAGKSSRAIRQAPIDPGAASDH